MCLAGLKALSVKTGMPRMDTLHKCCVKHTNADAGREALHVPLSVHKGQRAQSWAIAHGGNLASLPEFQVQGRSKPSEGTRVRPART